MVETARRYSRHAVLPQIGEAGQAKLAQSRVLVVGAGGLGSPCALYLAAAGIGTIGLLDHDQVELSNLNRQILYETGDIGRSKVDAARDRLEEFNPDIAVITHREKLVAENAGALIEHYDIVADGSDNFATRFLVSDACLRLRKPLVSAAISGFEGQLSTFKPYLGNGHPCYRCLVPDMPKAPEHCSETGALGAVAGILGSWQTMEIIKELLGLGESLSGKLLRFDGISGEVRIARLRQDKGCSRHAA